MNYTKYSVASSIINDRGRVQLNDIKDKDSNRYHIMPASLDYFVIETDLHC